MCANGSQAPAAAAAGAGQSGPGGASGSGGFEETAYGPPWGGIQGNGVTATGVNLTAGQPLLEIAIDPRVLQLRAYYHVWPNPFSTHGAFLAGDTGGAILGNHIDTYDWRGRADQNAWGARGGVQVTKAANPGAANVTDQIQAPASTLSSVQGNCSQLVSFVTGPGVYTDPFPPSQTHLTRDRIDQGVDYTGTGPIVAMGDGTVTLSRQFDPGWAGANGVPFSCAGGHAGAIVYRMSGGPDAGRFIYITEGLSPTVPATQNGQPTVVHKGEVIAQFTGCIEIGWGSGAGDQPMAQVTTPSQSCTHGDAGCHSSWCGWNMSQLIKSEGGPSGIQETPIFGDGC
jgi:3D (Asp-Asp-Asp) domain-containing protein